MVVWRGSELLTRVHCIFSVIHLCGVVKVVVWAPGGSDSYFAQSKERITRRCQRQCLMRIEGKKLLFGLKEGFCILCLKAHEIWERIWHHHFVSHLAVTLGDIRSVTQRPVRAFVDWLKAVSLTFIFLHLRRLASYVACHNNNFSCIVKWKWNIWNLGFDI